MRELCKGNVLEINDNLKITEDYTVMVAVNGLEYIPVGTCKNHLTWFKQTKKPTSGEITEIIYLGEYKWGVKHFTPIIEEFNSLSDSIKEDILTNFLNAEEENDDTDYEDSFELDCLRHLV